MADISMRVFFLFGHVPKTNAEKRRAVTHALDDLGLWRQPDAWIAKQCFVSRSLVAVVRKELEHARQTEMGFLTLAAAWHKANDAARMRFAEFAGRWEPGVPDPNWRMLDNVGIGDGYVEG